MKGRLATVYFNYESPELPCVSQISEELQPPHVVDNIILVSYVEISTEMRRAITVPKVRGSDNIQTFWEFRVGSNGLSLLQDQVDNTDVVSQLPFSAFHGLLARSPSRLERDSFCAELELMALPVRLFGDVRGVIVFATLTGAAVYQSETIENLKGLLRTREFFWRRSHTTCSAPGRGVIACRGVVDESVRRSAAPAQSAVGHADRRARAGAVDGRFGRSRAHAPPAAERGLRVHRADTDTHRGGRVDAFNAGLAKAAVSTVALPRGDRAARRPDGPAVVQSARVRISSASSPDRPVAH